MTDQHPFLPSTSSLYFAHLEQAGLEYAFAEHDPAEAPNQNIRMK